jgi:hypothetical protein
VRFAALSFFRMLRTCTLTVFSCMSNWAAIAQKIDYRKLARREVRSVRSPLPFTFRLVIQLRGCRAQRIGRNEGATRADKPERSYRNFPFD